MLNIELIIALFSLIISIFSLLVAIWSILITKKIAVTDRKAQVFQDAIVYIDKISFRASSPKMGFGDALIKEVDDEWIKKEVLVALEIKTKLNLFDDKKANLFWDIVAGFYSKSHIFECEKYYDLKREIKSELEK